MVRFSTLTIMMLMATAALADQEACAGGEETCVGVNSMLVTKTVRTPAAEPEAATNDAVDFGEGMTPAALMELSEEMGVEMENQKAKSSVMEDAQELSLNNAKAHLTESLESREAENSHVIASDAAQYASDRSSMASNTKHLAIQAHEKMVNAKAEFEKMVGTSLESLEGLADEKKALKEMGVKAKTKTLIANKLKVIAEVKEKEMSSKSDASQAKEDVLLIADTHMHAAQVAFNRATADDDEKQATLEFSADTLADATNKVHAAKLDEEEKNVDLGRYKANMAQAEVQDQQAVNNRAIAMNIYHQKETAAHKLDQSSTGQTARAIAVNRISQEQTAKAKSQDEAAKALPPVTAAAAAAPA